MSDKTNELSDEALVTARDKAQAKAWIASKDDAVADIAGLRAVAKLAADRFVGESAGEQVERACVGFYEDVSGLTSWARMVAADQNLAEKYRVAMRAALIAAGVTPQAPKPQSGNLTPIWKMIEEMGEGRAAGILVRGREDEYPISYFIDMLEEALNKAAQVQAPPVPDEAKLAEVITQQFDAVDLLTCTRDWSAWRYGTMTEDDFSDAGNEPQIALDIARAVIAHLTERSGS